MLGGGPIWIIEPGRPFPPSATATGQPVAASVSSQATLQHPPPQLLNAPIGSVLQAVVLGKAPEGGLLVRTPVGVLTLATQAAIAPGTAVALQVHSVGAQILFAILPQGGGAAGTGPTAAIQPPGQPALPPQPATITSGSLITGTLTALPSTAAAGSAAPTAGAAPAGTAAAVASGYGPSGGATGQQPVVPGQAPAPGTHPGLAARLGTEVAFRVIGVQPPSAQVATLPSPPPGAAVLSGTVIGFNATGQPILHTGSGEFTLRIRADFPVQTRVALEALGPRFAPTPLATSGAGHALLSLAQAYPELDLLLQGLARADGQAFAQALSSVPRPGGQMGATLLFFLTALGAGDISRWLNPQARGALEKAGRPELLRQLGDRFSSLSRMAVEPQLGDWRGFAVPFHDGEHLRQIMIYVRDRHADTPEGEEDMGKRFIVDFSLSRLGAMQIDGLVKERRFDLVLRSATDLPQAMRDHVTQLFVEANEITGFRGTIRFQVKPDNGAAVSPLAEMDQHLESLVV